ncbi:MULTISPECIES: heavy metal translocating P-type ATPase [unclassified Sphingobium]|uniref:heavy metal translocating P-type ATPase n=1 Tax=unclassified Sphingobium TaxID=2611147 RepID=UPI0022242413|nr:MULTISPECIES: heavy metal translocating P-type ATPase [unclassified Sphingobium]MCW2394874.1 Cu2+-exporting ATPase [Sphingobium sp. B8D3B]MCW2418388.1 Cu2+-exporting ATPase [Sphingobium sp. B8D3C]
MTYVAPRPDWSADAVETRLAVPDMHCAGCISKIERLLPLQPGVHAARVNFSAKTVIVSHAADLAEPDLLRAFDAIGFEAQPLHSAAAHERSQALRKLIRALAVAAFAAMNVMLLSVSVWSGADGSARELFHWISALIAIPAVAYSGQPFFRSAFKALRAGTTNMDVPISIGVILATSMSLYETIIGGRHAWFDGALMLLTFLLAGRVLDEMMRARAASGAEALVRRTAPGAMRLAEDGASQWVAADALAVGDRVLVAAGERLAADGVIEQGSSRFDLSLLTGESAPVTLRAGDMATAGTLNLDGPVTLRVTAVGEGRAIAEIARLMESAGQAKSRYVRLADKCSRLYAPVVHLLAAITFAGWMIAGAGWHQSLLVAIAVLIITCPCALGLAVPVAQVVVCGAMMRAGLLVKDGSALERLAQADQALFDKTGTLTLGRPRAFGVEALDEEERSIARALAMTSRHPLAVALRQALGGEHVGPAVLADVEDIPGEGVRALWQGHPVAMGKPTPQDLSDQAGASDDPTMAVALELAHGRRHIIRFADALRPDAARALADLRGLGLPPAIMSGDREEAVQSLADQLSVPAEGGMRPADKLARLQALAEAGHKPLMVGDGLNDGPALAAAHVSMAPGSASDVGQQAADIVFLGDSLSGIPKSVRASRATMRIVRQNIGLAIGYNALAVPLAIAGYVTPLIAAVAMSSSSLIVVANSLRLRWAVK